MVLDGYSALVGARYAKNKTNEDTNDNKCANIDMGNMVGIKEIEL